jgi:hypothetical protein
MLFTSVGGNATFHHGVCAKIGPRLFHREVLMPVSSVAVIGRPIAPMCMTRLQAAKPRRDRLGLQGISVHQRDRTRIAARHVPA